MPESYSVRVVKRPYGSPAHDKALLIFADARGTQPAQRVNTHVEASLSEAISHLEIGALGDRPHQHSVWLDAGAPRAGIG